jgi:phosphoadenosine phosphosulfate reductase
MPDILTSAETLVRSYLDESNRKVCLTCSFQAEDVVVLHLLRAQRPDVPVLFLETGYHFAETYAYRDRLTAEWNLNLVNLAAQQSVADQEAQFGILNQTDPSRCCQLRKVEPLIAGLDPFDVWFTGLRREQSPTRAGLQEEEWHRFPAGKTLRKVSPLAAWTWKDVWSYLAANDIPHLPLYDQGYLSIGCEPCTQKPLDASNPRSGRWGGRKLECGIHTVSQEA